MTRTLVALLVASTLGCGSDPDTTFVPRGAGDYCEAIEPFFCSFYVRCGRMDVATAAECKDAFLTSCNGQFEPRYVDLETAGLLALDVDGIAACRQHLDAVACDQQILELAGPCADMWRGQQPQGASCGLDVESFVCAPGGECVLGLDFCGDCRPLVAEGMACVPGADTCGNEGSCEMGICVARVRNGEACGPSDRCLTGSLCESGICTPPSYVARGEACDQRKRCPYLTRCAGGSCVPTASPGDPCGTDGQCEIGFCEGVCQDPRANGQPCTRAGQCSSGQCDGSTCQALPSACIAP